MTEPVIWAGACVLQWVSSCDLHIILSSKWTFRFFCCFLVSASLRAGYGRAILDISFYYSQRQLLLKRSPSGKLSFWCSFNAQNLVTKKLVHGYICSLSYYICICNISFSENNILQGQYWNEKYKHDSILQEAMRWTQGGKNTCSIKDSCGLWRY